ncbi:ABC transporter ATP-binding protein [uncultured Levyella sp.]|uniref:ABC transporter ATP-binding protein n=1 Tax=uncultured Levyella sp. TaxID=1715800 RepID=UPI00258E3E4A|nr:ABC transporter ATP-binding protein [uncultured Levyella sp.]
MKRKLQETFALTEKGARGMIRASIASFCVNITYMAAMMTFFAFAKDLLADGKLSHPAFYLLAMAVIVVLMYLTLDFEYRATYNTTYAESRDMRIAIADTMKELPLGYFAKHDLSDLAQTMMQDVLDMEHAFSHAVPQAIGAGIFLVIMLIMILISHFWIGLAILIPTAVGLTIILLSKRYQKSFVKKFYDQSRKNVEIIQDAIEMQQEIRSYNLVGEKRREIHQAIRAAEKMHMQAEVGQGIPVMSAMTVVKLALASTILTVAYFMLKGQMTALYAIGYMIAATRLTSAMEGVSMNIAELFDIDVRVDRIKELQNTPVQKGREVELKNFDIEVKDLSFAYGKNPVLNGVNFSAKQGEVTALVGPSGSGKTTMIRLLSRLYDVDRGEITIGGHSLKDIAPDCLYRQISMVFQDVTLFNGTVMENIRIGRKDASDEEVMEAARKAHCDDFIVKLPDGYQTLIGENGSKLSGGERQRLSIARAFLKDAPILLLDEISASLDVENEMAIQKSLNTLMKNKTVIIISHRMKSIENVNQIVVFEDGRVNGIGRHEELMTRSKLYRNLVEKSSLTEAYVY